MRVMKHEEKNDDSLDTFDDADDVLPDADDSLEAIAEMENEEEEKEDLTEE